MGPGEAKPLRMLQSFPHQKEAPASRREARAAQLLYTQSCTCSRHQHMPTRTHHDFSHPICRVLSQPETYSISPLGLRNTLIPRKMMKDVLYLCPSIFG